MVYGMIKERKEREMRADDQLPLTFNGGKGKAKGYRSVRVPELECCTST